VRVYPPPSSLQTLSRTQHYLYEPDACRLRRLSSDKTLDCLEGSHVAFVGDSITRYQFTSLVRFIAAGGYQVGHEMPCLGPRELGLMCTYKHLRVNCKTRCLFDVRNEVRLCGTKRYWYIH